MPKPLKKTGRLPEPPKRTRSSDPNRAAQAILAEHMGRVQPIQEVEPPSFQEQYKAHMAKLGAKGGKVSGAKRMSNLSDAARSEIALRAATARWDKERAKKKRAK